MLYYSEYFLLQDFRAKSSIENCGLLILFKFLLEHFFCLLFRFLLKIKRQIHNSPSDMGFFGNQNMALAQGRPNMSSKGFPGGSLCKESFRQCRRHKRCGFNSWVGKIPWRKKWSPSPVSLHRRSHGSRQATVRGVTKSQTRLSSGMMMSSWDLEVMPRALYGTPGVSDRPP